MQIILFINKDVSILNSINSIDLRYYNVVTLNDIRFIEHYLEEYMPGYVLISADMTDMERITEFADNYNSINFIIASGKKDNKSLKGISSINKPGVLYLNNIDSFYDYKKVLKTIDDIGIKKDNFKLSELEFPRLDEELNFINQQVVSIFSTQGGIGKTTLSANIASFLGRTKKIKVLLIDMNFSEGPSDLSLKMRISSYPNLSVFIEKVSNSHQALDDSILKIKDLNISVLLPPVSLYQSDKFDVELLNSLIYSARSIYNYIIVDLPCRFDNVFMEMLNLSTIILFITGSEESQVLRPINYLKFLPHEQKKGLVINNINEIYKLDIKDIRIISEIPVFAEIPLVKKNEMKFLKIGKTITGVLDIQPYLIDLVNNIALI